jgi:hypothetical protein
MPDRAIHVYLNDHLAGATLGADLAEQIAGRHADSELGRVMKPIADEIAEDRETLLRLMEEMGTSKNPVKQAAGWAAEKASRVKFSGMSSGQPDQGAFMALESLSLGVEGKRSLWQALREVADDYPPLASTDLEELIRRAEGQRSVIERERLAAAGPALGPG